MDLEKQITRGKRAEQILNDDLIKEAKELIDAKIAEQFRKCRPDDADALMHVRQMQYIHDKYWEVLTSVITNGKVAAINLEAKRKASLAKRIFG